MRFMLWLLLGDSIIGHHEGQRRVLRPEKSFIGPKNNDATDRQTDRKIDDQYLPLDRPGPRNRTFFGNPIEL
jgi:hypothetical protein